MMVLVKIQMRNTITVRNKLLLFAFLLIYLTHARAQTLVFGGFVSFAISDSLSANSGGAMVSQDTRMRCIMLQGGTVYGQSEMYNVSGTFKENCNDAQRMTELRVYPNPGFGEYWVEGQSIEKIEVFDNLGRLIKNMEVKEKGENLWKTHITLMDQPEGNYFVKIRDSSGEQWVYLLIKLKS